MKNKIKLFVKKIRNWLFSLCKWAKKHIIKLIMVITALVVVLVPYFSSEKTVEVRAESPNNQNVNTDSTHLYSERPLIILPSVPIQFESLDYTVYLCQSYIGYYNGGYYMYIVSSESQVDNYGFTGYPLYSNNRNDIPLMYVDVRDSNAYYYYCSEPYGNSRASRVEIIFETAPDGYTFTYNDIITYGSMITFTYQPITASSITQEFNYIIYANDEYYRTVMCTIRISGVYRVSDSTRIDFPLTFSASNITTSQLYDSIYSIGYYNGVTYGLNQQAINPLSIIASGVDSFLSINLFGNFSFADLISIGAGCILFMFVVKMFLGG